MDAPLILTLELDAPSAQFFNQLRQTHFPPERNFLAAHVTLFHALPGENQDEIGEVLAEIGAQTSPFTLKFPDLMFLGRGVAAKIESPELLALHRQLQSGWKFDLSPQDAQKLRPHITFQNKVAPAVARKLFEEMSQNWQILEGQGIGLALCHYRGGPWELAQKFDFQSEN